MTSQPPQDEVEEVARALCDLEYLQPMWDRLPETEAEACRQYRAGDNPSIGFREQFREGARVAIATLDRLRSAAPAEEGWRPIETADFDGSPALVYRPLARASHDEPVAIKRLIGGHHRCWAVTVPKGTKPFNPTDGLCHVTHFMPIPTPPKDETHG